MRAKKNHPIATKLIRKMKKQVRAKVVHLEAVMAGRAYAEELQRTVASPEEMDGFHPAHAAYVTTQNQGVACRLDFPCIWR